MCTFAHNKPLIVLAETDPEKGAPTVESLNTELAHLMKRSDFSHEEETAARRLIAVFENGQAIEWHREKQCALRPSLIAPMICH